MRLLRGRERYRGWGVGGDVLTVDDATRAGAEACWIARELGHEVIFFVNPLQVSTGMPYFFSALDAHIEARTPEVVSWNGEAFDLRERSEVRRFRRAAKAVLMKMMADDALAAAHELGRIVSSTAATMPDFSAPISVSQLRELHALGVRIENHGWSHVEISALDDDAFARHIRDGVDWLRREIEAEATLYAVPFGLTEVVADRLPLLDDVYFLADESRPPGQVAPRAWNRIDITTELQER